MDTSSFLSLILLDTPQQKKSIMNALLRSNSDIKAHESSSEDGDILLSLDLKDSCTPIGQDFSLGINLTNKSGEEKSIRVYLRINAALYTGGVGRSVRSEWDSHKVAAGES